MPETGKEGRLGNLERVTKKFRKEVSKDKPNRTELVNIFNDLYDLATKDPLTGVLNRRSFDEALGKEVSKAIRFNRSLCIVMIDIDNFKRYNDSYGHQQGDFALKKVTKIIQSGTRDTDFVARYGGEEFIIVLPETKLNHGKEIAERIRKKVETARITPSRKNLPKGYEKVTISMGIAEMHENAKKEKIGKILEKADDALYKAKALGRNQMVIAE